MKVVAALPLSLPLTVLLVPSLLARVDGAVELPPIAELIERAYPTWCIDADEKRLDDETCSDGSPNGRFTPIYLHKYPGIGKDPALGGYPTPIDTRYPFENASPFFGQVGAGSIYHCPASFDGDASNYKTHCGKVLTKGDNGAEGAGHIAPHIALAATTRAYKEEFADAGPLEDWFDVSQNGCRILPNVLLKFIRKYYPRDANGKAYYPPPHSKEGGAYPLEFRNLIGDTCVRGGEARDGDLLCFDNHSGTEDLYPDYLAVGHDSPRYCTKEGIDADVPTDWCPYIFFGPNRGKYRHPHIAFSSLETYLDKLATDQCKTTWDDSSYPPEEEEGTHLHFPEMTKGGLDEPQPVIADGGWAWPGPDGLPLRAVPGKFSVYAYGAPPGRHARATVNASAESSSSLGAGAVAGIVVGAVAAAALVVIAVTLVKRGPAGGKMDEEGGSINPPSVA